MKWLSSGTTLIIQIILVAAGVLVFAYFDPFGIFVSNKLRLADTPSHVQQIRAIGELITAEYYGEVISSYQDVLASDSVEEIKVTNDRIEKLNQEFIDSLGAISQISDDRADKEKKKRFNKALDYFKQRDFFDAFYDKAKSVIGIKIWEREFVNFLDSKNIQTLSNGSKSIIAELKKTFKDDIKRDFKKKFVKRSQLLLIGRGKVQAGFRFNKLDNRNVWVDEAHNRIVIYGMTPEILSWDINPWFIPEMGIKGYEILDYTKKADNPAILNSVKKACKDSLLAHAKAGKILELAKHNAEENLKEFFSLILDNPKIEVKIVSNNWDFYMRYMITDSVLNYSELTDLYATILDSCFNSSLIRKSTLSYSLKAFELIDSLKHCRLVIGDSIYYKINPFTIPIYRLLKSVKQADKPKNQFKSELDTLLKSILNNPAIYQPWFYDWKMEEVQINDSILKTPQYQSYLKEGDQFFKREYARIYPDKKP